MKCAAWNYIAKWNIKCSILKVDNPSKILSHLKDKNKFKKSQGLIFDNVFIFLSSAFSSKLGNTTHPINVCGMNGQIMNKWLSGWRDGYGFTCRAVQM